MPCLSQLGVQHLCRERLRVTYGADDLAAFQHSQEGQEMNLRGRSFAMAVAVLLVSSGGASAQTIADVTRQWGLVGTWSVNCPQRASESNGRTTYVPRADG